MNITNNTADGRNFFAVGGTLDVAEGSVPLGGLLGATASDVTFVEMLPDLSAPLPEGECLHLATAAIDLP